MAAHPIDFELQAEVFATAELKALFDEKARLQRWLKFEAALAQTQATLGIVPVDSAEEITRRAKLDELDLEAVKAEYRVSRNSVMPVLKALRKACKPPHGEYVHYGATTQDVSDTGEVLEIKDALAIVRRDLAEIGDYLSGLALQHRDTPMIGRTHSQQALPVTFGAKVAIWLVEVQRHLVRIDDASQRVLVGQLGGGGRDAGGSGKTGSSG